MTDTIIYEQIGHVGRLVLNKPEQHNSLGRLELEAIQGRLAAVATDSSVRVLLVTGTGEKTFCAGASLKELGAGEISGDCFQNTTDQLAAMPIPTICALNGNVFGGGVELALSCDFRLGIRGTRMRVPAAAIGLCYPISGINRFVERLGVNVAKRILVAAEEFRDDAMVDIGFLDYLVAREELEAKSSELSQRIAGLAPLAVRAMKEILQEAAAGDIDMTNARSLSERCAKSEDLQEGFRAQREKRAPEFQGA
jgi:enoyl-CoA hydratase/carnithine racemase